MGNRDNGLRYLKDVKTESKNNNENKAENISFSSGDIESLKAKLEHLEQRIDNLPEQINASFRRILQENPCLRSLQSINSLLERVDSKLEAIEEYLSLNDAREVRQQLIIVRNALNILPGDLHNFIGRKFEFMQEEMNRPKGSIDCFRPPLKDLRLKSQLKYFLFTVPLWWLKTEKVKSFCKQMGVILLSICTAILLFLVIYLANDNRHQRQEKQLLQQMEHYKSTAQETTLNSKILI